MSNLADHSALNIEFFDSQVGWILHFGSKTCAQCVNSLLVSSQSFYSKAVCVFHGIWVGHVADL